MRYPRQVTFLVGAVLAIGVTACDDGGSARVVGQDGSTIDVPAATATATPSADVSPAIVPGDGTPMASVTPTATETAAPTQAASSTATATRTPGSTEIEEFEGVPYSTSDFQAALPASLTVEAIAADESLCPDASVVETTLRVDGGDGSTWALWVYPDSAAREADWTFSDGALQAETDDCDPPTGLNYFNANVVLVLREMGEGVEAMRDAFLSMSAE